MSGRPGADGMWHGVPSPRQQAARPSTGERVLEYEGCETMC